MSNRLILNGFQKGYRGDLPATDVQRGASPNCMNLVHYDGAFRPRLGRRAHCAVPTASGIRALAHYHDDSIMQLFAATETKILRTDAAGQTFGNSADIGLTIDPANKIRMCQFKDAMYFVDGVNPVKRWKSGTGVESILGVDAPTRDITVSYSSVPISLGYLDNGDEKGMHHGFTFGTPRVYTLDVANASELSAYRTDAMTEAEIAGATVRKFTQQQGSDGVVKPFLGLEVVNSRTATLGMPMHVWGKVNFAANPVDLSTANLVQIEFKLVGSGDMPELFLHLGAEDDQYTTVPYHVAGLTIARQIPTAGLTWNTWHTVQVAISDADIGDKDSIGFLAISMDATDATKAENRLELGTGVFDSANTKGVTLLISSITVDISASKFVPGAKYTFAYTYQYANEESGMNPTYAEVTLNDSVYNLPLAMSIVTVCDDVDPLPQYVNIYAAGGSLGPNLILIKQLPITADGNYTFDWDGTFSGSVIPIPEYVDAPPFYAPSGVYTKGPTIIYSHKGRMVYVFSSPKDASGAANTVYLSNWDDPEHVPQEPTLNTPPEMGGWVTVGEEDSPVLAVAPWASTLLVMKEQGVWRLEGELANQTFLIPMDMVHGCISHETAQAIDPGTTVWLGLDHVWACTADGSVVNIGVPIENKLKEFSRQQQENAYAFYDKQYNWYCLVIPAPEAIDAAAPSTSNRGAMFVLSATRTSRGQMFAWFPCEAVPSNCGIYVADFPTPGVYCGDRGVAELIRFNEGYDDGGEPIEFHWWSNVDTFPMDNAAKSPTEMLLDCSGSDQALVGGLWLGYRQPDENGLIWEECGSPDSRTELFRWRMPFTQPTVSYQVGFGGESSGGGQFASLEVDVNVRGRR